MEKRWKKGQKEGMQNKLLAMLISPSPDDLVSCNKYGRSDEAV
jgi:hypothetical protein